MHAPFRNRDLVAPIGESARDDTSLAVSARLFARAFDFTLTARNTATELSIFPLLERTRHGRESGYMGERGCSYALAILRALRDSVGMSALIFGLTR